MDQASSSLPTSRPKRKRGGPFGNKYGQTHGLSKGAEYKAWRDMRRRCSNPNVSSFKHYGGRGITVCPSWNESFEAFYADVGPRPSPDHSLDRWPDVNGNYEPGNVRWATRIEQVRNKRNNRLVHYAGREMSLTEACQLAGVSITTVQYRLNTGWDAAKALSTPVDLAKSAKRRRNNFQP